MAPPKTTSRGCDMAMIAAIKKVRSPISVANIIPKAFTKALPNPSDGALGSVRRSAACACASPSTALVPRTDSLPPGPGSGPAGAEADGAPEPLVPPSAGPAPEGSSSAANALLPLLPPVVSG